MKNSMKNSMMGLSGIGVLAMLFVISAASATASGDISIMQWYPQGSNYVFVCNPGFAATTYDFSFGDGQKLMDMTSNNVYHTYTQSGEYEVACTASNETFNKVYLLRVGVGTNQTVPPIGDQSAELQIAPYFPQGPDGRDYVFNCNAFGFTPTSYDWDFGDGQKLYDMPVNDVFHRFDQSGSYTVNCAASNSAYRVGASKIIAGGIPETPTNTSDSESNAAVLSVAPYYPQGSVYVFVCTATGFTPTSYDWDFGDGSKLLGMSSDNVWHAYGSGTFDVSCTAMNNETSETGLLQVVQTPT